MSDISDRRQRGFFLTRWRPVFGALALCWLVIQVTPTNAQQQDRTA